MQGTVTETGAILDHQLHATRRAEAAHGRRRNGDDARLFDGAQTLLQCGRGGEGGGPVQALLKRIQHGEHGTGLAVVAEGRARESGEAHGVLESRCVQHGTHDLLHHRIGASDGGAVGQLHVDDEIPLILIRDQTRGQLLETVSGEHDQSGVKDQHDACLAGHGTDRAGIAVAGALEGPVESAKKPAHGVVE